MIFDTSLLKFLFPIKQLQPDLRIQMADQAQIVEMSIGDELSANEEHRWFIYLLKGRIDLLDVNSVSMVIDDKDERCHFPIFAEKERKLHIIAHCTSVLIRFDKQLFTTFLEQELISGEELETVEMSEVEANLFNVIMHDFNMGTLSLPSLPDIAKRIKKATSKMNLSVDDLAKVISADPAIAIKLIHAANVNNKPSQDAATDIPAAISRLGLDESKALVSLLAKNELFNSSTSILNQRMHELYDRSIDVASIGFSLSKQSKKLSADYVKFAGLVHDIGVMPILAYIEKSGLLIADDQELCEIIEHLRNVVGSMVIRHWNLPAEFQLIIENFENWQRQLSDEIDVCDLIIIAQIYRRLKHHQFDDLPKINTVPAFNKLFKQQVEADFAKKTFQLADEDVAAIMCLLNMQG